MINHHDKKWEQEKEQAREQWDKYYEVKEQNKKSGKRSFPRCENCFKICYLSGHATKVVCQKEPLYYCYKCYNSELEVLDEFKNRRICPNHEECVAFESKSDRTKYNNEDEGWTNYFRDTTKCEYHPEIKLFPEYLGMCYICDEDNPEMQLMQDEREQNLYRAAALFGIRYIQENETDPEKKNLKQGALLDAFYKADTPLQKEVKENKRKAAIAREKALEVFNKIIPENYFWFRKQIEKADEKDQILFEIQLMQEEKTPDEDIKICMGCMNIRPIGNLKHYEGIEWMCSLCFDGIKQMKIIPERNHDFRKLSRGYRQRLKKKQQQQ